MITRLDSPRDILLSALEQSGGTASFAEFTRRCDVHDDAMLAELIELHGRARLASGTAVELAEYLEAVPELPRLPAALDAAIDMSLRSLSGGPSPARDATETLSASYPWLATAIRDAAALGRALWATDPEGADQESARELPCEFGPPLQDGRAQYVLRERLGAGAFGEVYLATDRLLSEDSHEAPVAVKVVHRRGLGELLRRRAAEEASRARRIDHPNVVKVHCRGTTDDGEDFIVSEHVPGGTLEAWARGERWSAARCASLMADIAHGAHAAHAAGLVHRDLKPSNVLLTLDERPKIADFGAASVVDLDADHALLVGGTRAFAAPEQDRDPALSSTLSDVYSLGGMLYWLLTGRAPNRLVDDETRRIVPDLPEGRLVDRAGRRVPLALERICRRALCTTPTARHSSAAEFAEDLGRVMRREPVAWQRPGVVRRLVMWGGREPVKAAIAAGLVAALVTSVWLAIGWTQSVRWKRQRAVMFNQFAGAFGTITQDGFVTEQLTYIWLLDWLFSPKALDDPVLLSRTWSIRVDHARMQADSIAAAAGGETIESVLWRIAEGYWLVADGRSGEASAPLAVAAAGLGSLGLSDDPMAALIEALLACVEADAALLAEGPRDLGRARIAADRLESALRAPALHGASADGSGYRLLMHSRLAELYGPGWLDEPERAESSSSTVARLNASAS